jgi:lambda repressor-like predicted transcriptional regulator
MAERHRQPKTMSDQERIEIIVGLRRRGWTYKRIGQSIGMSANGVKYALHRVTQPGRHIEYDPEEVE